MKRAILSLSLLAGVCVMSAEVALASSSAYTTVDEEQVVLSAGTHVDAVFLRDETLRDKSERTGEEVADRDNKSGLPQAVAFLNPALGKNQGALLE
jgi:hypothetical protein